MILKKLLLYFNTVRHLKFQQFIFNVIRRFINKIKFVERTTVDCNQLILIAPLRSENTIDDNSLCFLNERRSFEYISNWQCLAEPKLWRYNLHYFDYLLDDAAAEEIKDKLIDEWITTSLRLKEDAWAPYPVSLRIVNWIKYFIGTKKNHIPQHWLDSLYQQSQVLFNSIEYHILANHYFKNAKALLFAGAYLQCDKSQTWFSKGEIILFEQLDEQLLSDGGHYEKSPMYHSIFVEDLLDIINLIQSNSLNIPVNRMSHLNDKTDTALDFLQQIILPDGEIPLFNDSAFRIAPDADSIFNYANLITGYAAGTPPSGLSIKSLAASGYFIIRDNNNMCIIDCGAISPEYQPGHSHCDLLSYELVLKGQKIIVDTGLHDYESSYERQYCRSTKAHNTIEIDSKEQSEIWGQFRVARRAKIHSADLSLVEDKTCVFKGSYSPYWSANHKIRHSRVVKYSDNKWSVSDTVLGDENHLITNYIHLYPGVDCRQTRSGDYYFIKENIKLARIIFSDNVEIHFVDGWYYPEFGLKKQNRVIELSYSGTVPVTLQYKIEAL